MRKLVLIAVLFAASPARADFAIGGFLGDPTGLDLKFGIANRSALDLLIGWYGWYGYRGPFVDAGYVHLTYLVTPLVGHGDAVLVPLRLGIGGAVFGDPNNDVNIGIRFPLEVGLRFKRAPLEIYGEIALMLAFYHPNDVYALVEGQGGIGLRFYF
jgi:hypothetical protein